MAQQPKRRKKRGNTDFATIAEKVSVAVGTSWCFLLALSFVLLWVVTGPLFNFSEGWQLVINTGTTIVTFLMVFLIQNTQNRETKIINLKLDELIKSHKGASNTSIDLNKLSDEELKSLEKHYHALCNKRTGQ